MTARARRPTEPLLLQQRDPSSSSKDLRDPDVPPLGGFAGLGTLVQRFWGNIRAIWPRDGSTIKKEPGEILRLFQWLEHLAVEPTRKVNSSLNPIIKDESDPEFPTIFGVDYNRKGFHTAFLNPTGRSFPRIRRLSPYASLLPIPGYVQEPSL